ncbi:PqqD family peptide modification chaperone [Amycolatopsis magusensis]|uniref:Molybdopterin/thiamine biosynthesis adenylyltransferase n=1 Tax=Amycolatopsis magusensis TaxID=882444 RepID=A0ABS4Q5L7_9PSEU|nr:PqqD family peptide modification chaperone [Amycolatopsis magusensis]MBP2186883.1 molybdopterin/thiamine biosynthesis adenylyltransferase [Amycolatopsis magusensis]
MRPRIRDAHRPVRFGDGWNRIGGKVFGIAAELRDPDGVLWALLELLDGTRTVGQIVAELAHHFPAYPAGEAEADIEELVRLGYVEDADEPPCPALSARQRERHSRGRLLNRWIDLARRGSSWDFLVRLAGARVVVIGVGGGGCTAALNLGMSGVGHLHCVDPDVVELSNLNRQILYTEPDQGRLKVDVAVERLRAANSDIEVTGEAKRIDGVPPLQRLAADCDVLVMVADQPAEIRTWANQACARTGTPWVYGGYHGPQINVGVYRPGTGPCYECARLTERDREAQRPMVATWRSATALPAHAANAVTAGVVGNLVAHAVLSLLTGAPQLPLNCQYGFSLATMDHSFITRLDRPHPDCPTCAMAA